MYFVGFDPSLSCTGVVVLRDDDPKPVLAAAFKSKLKGFARIIDYRTQIVTALDAVLTEPPACVAIEDYATSKSAFTVMQLTELGTMLRLLFIDRRWRYVDPTPSQVHAFVGFKKTPKVKKNKATAALRKPINQVRDLWSFTHDSEDVVDAYVIAQIARGMRPRAGLVLSKKMLETVHGVAHGAFIAT